jgi:hypothetical protein
MIVSMIDAKKTSGRLTVLAGDGSEIEDISLAALGDSATAESRVGLGNDDGGTGGESENGGGELHGD